MQVLEPDLWNIRETCGQHTWDMDILQELPPQAAVEQNLNAGPMGAPTRSARDEGTARKN